MLIIGVLIGQLVKSENWCLSVTDLSFYLFIFYFFDTNIFIEWGMHLID